MRSIMEHGILSHNRAEALPHDSTAMTEIQERRAQVTVPGGRPLHDYANLYFHARNPMMYLRQAEHASLCVLSVKTEVLDIPGTAITDRNASTDYVRFAPSPEGLTIVDKDLTFAVNWTHNDYYEQLRRKQAKQAEVLVLGVVPPEFIKGAYVSGPVGEADLTALESGCKMRQRPSLFFR